MSQQISFQVRDIKGDIRLVFHHPIELRFHIRDNEEVVCEVPYLRLEVGGDSLEEAMDKTVRTIRAMTKMFINAHAARLSEKEKVQKGLFLEIVDIAATFDFLGDLPDNFN